MVCMLKFTKGHNSVKTIDGIPVLVLSHCLIMFYTCIKFQENIAKGFRETDLNSRVNAKVVANVDGQTNERTESGSLYRAMPTAGATKSSYVPSPDSNPGLLVGRRTLYHVDIKPGLYSKAV